MALRPLLTQRSYSARRPAPAPAPGVTGGHRLDRKGYFIAPTLLTGVRENMLLTKEESFGSVVVVIRFDCEEEVLSRPNDTARFSRRGVDPGHQPRAPRSNLPGSLHRLAQLPVRAGPGNAARSLQAAWLGQEYGLEGVEA